MTKKNAELVSVWVTRETRDNLKTVAAYMKLDMKDYVAKKVAVDFNKLSKKK